MPWLLLWRCRAVQEPFFENMRESKAALHVSKTVLHVSNRLNSMLKPNDQDFYFYESSGLIAQETFSCEPHSENESSMNNHNRALETFKLIQFCALSFSLFAWARAAGEEDSALYSGLYNENNLRIIRRMIWYFQKICRLHLCQLQ